MVTGGVQGGGHGEDGVQVGRPHQLRHATMGQQGAGALQHLRRRHCAAVGHPQQRQARLQCALLHTSQPPAQCRDCSLSIRELFAQHPRYLQLYWFCNRALIED